MLVCKQPTNTALLIRFTSQNGAVAVVAEHWATRGIPLVKIAEHTPNPAMEWTVKHV
jgi:hypothetical protein